MSGLARVRTGRGSFKKFVKIAKGEPEDFPSTGELKAKFEDLGGPYLSPERIETLVQALLSLDEASDIGGLLRLARADAVPPLKVVAGDD